MVNFWTILVVSVASLLKGITGFGFALISLPFLMLWYSPKELIPILLICNLFASIIIVLQKKERNLVSKQYWSLIIFGGIFTVFGVLTLKFIPEHFLIHALGVLFILLSILLLVTKRVKLKLTKLSYKIAGSIIGFLTGSISVSGPPLVLFLNATNADNKQFREVFAWFNIVTALIAIGGYIHLHLITTPMLKLTLIFIPIMYIGTYIGKRLNAILPALLFKRISIVFTIIAAIMMLIH